MKAMPLIDAFPNAFKRSLRIPPPPERIVEEYSRVFREQCLIIASKQAYIPYGLDADDLANIIFMEGWERVLAYGRDEKGRYPKMAGAKTLREYSNRIAYFALKDWGRKRNKDREERLARGECDAFECEITEMETVADMPAREEGSEEEDELED